MAFDTSFNFSIFLYSLVSCCKAADPSKINGLFSGGSCEIRTHGGLTSSPVFKTGALNRSAKLPVGDILTGLFGGLRLGFEHAFGFDERNYFF